MDADYLPLIIIPSFLILFPLFWMGVVALISLMAGWSGLAKRYRFTGKDFPNERYGSARIRVANYRMVLRVGHDARGLYLGVMALFRPGHPNLFIPWSDMTMSQQKGFFRGGMRIEINDGPPILLYGDWPELERARG